MSLESKTEPRPGWTGELGGIHSFTKVLGEVVISVGTTNYQLGLVAVEGAPPMKSSLLSDSVVLLSKYDSLFSRLLSAPFHVHPQSHALHLQSLQQNIYS